MIDLFQERHAREMAAWGCGVLHIFDPKGEGDFFAHECRPQMQSSTQEQSQMILLSRVVRGGRRYPPDKSLSRGSVVCFLNTRIHEIAIHLVDSVI